MSVFNEYSSYYDLLYQAKNYNAEANYVDGIIKNFSPTSTKILEFGCGSGRHASLMAEKGYCVTGVDLSQNMVKLAKEKTQCLGESQKLSFCHGDMRSIRLNKKFDVVMALFHVMSYQTTDKDVCDAFETAYEHLVSGGLFIFDFWYGPAVLKQRPELKVKKVEDDKIKVTRISEPQCDVEKNLVDVNFTVFVENKKDSTIKKYQETHNMRYLFQPEVARLCQDNSFELVTFEEWLSGKKPVVSSWGVCAVGRKV
jgi:SAM-dependent methyltransferase